MMNKTEKGLYAITDFSVLSDQEVIEKTEQILICGISLFQYRNKITDNQPARMETIKTLQTLCKEFNTPFIINDNIELAKAINADGVHLGRDDASIESAREYLGPVLIGKSCYNDIELAKQAQGNGSDYIAFGAFFPSQTKPHAVKATPDLLKQSQIEINLPVVAIGGVTPKNARVLLDAGADMLAVINALYGANDLASVMDEFTQAFKQ